MPGGGSPGRYRSKPKTRAAPSSALPLRVDLLTAQIAEGANGSQEQSSQKWLSDLLCEAPVYLEAKPLSVRPMPPALFLDGQVPPGVGESDREVFEFVEAGPAWQHHWLVFAPGWRLAHLLCGHVTGNKAQDAKLHETASNSNDCLSFATAHRSYIFWHQPSLHAASSAQAMGRLSYKRLADCISSPPGLMDGQHKHVALQDWDPGWPGRVVKV